MAEKKTKTAFVGLRLTAGQAELLDRLQRVLNSATKTEVLLKGLDLLGKLYPSTSIPPPGILLGEGETSPPVVTNRELAMLDAEARRYSTKVQQVRNKTKEVMKQMAQELSKTDGIVDKYKGDKSSLIQLLLELQRENHWLSEEMLKWVSQKMDIPLSQIYRVATFYKAFSLVPRGRHSISVCMGTACHVRGAPHLLDKVMDTLKIRPGETTRDMRFSLDTVNCLGCCALGPVMVVDGKYYSKPSTKEIEQIAASD